VEVDLPRRRQNGARLTYYQPQIDSWTDYRQLDGRVAVVLTPANGQSVPGMIILRAQTDTDLDDRIVAIHDIHVTKALFPSLDDAAQEKIRSSVEDQPDTGTNHLGFRCVKDASAKTGSKG
jgi:hypothetical protein